MKLKKCGWVVLASLALVGCDSGPEDQLQVEVKEPGETAKSVDGCDRHLRFCLKAKVSGAETVSGVSGFGGPKSCAEWVAGGAARVLELPGMLPMPEKNSLTVGLTRLAAYTGPGEYTLVSTRQGGIPDMLPVMDTGARSFGAGPDSTTKVRIFADGSGTLEADNLVEIKAAHRMREPDLAARVKLSLQWTCRDPDTL